MGDRGRPPSPGVALLVVLTSISLIVALVLIAGMEG